MPSLSWEKWNSSAAVLIFGPWLIGLLPAAIAVWLGAIDVGSPVAAFTHRREAERLAVLENSRAVLVANVGADRKAYQLWGAPLPIDLASNEKIIRISRASSGETVRLEVDGIAVGSYPWLAIIAGAQWVGIGRRWCIDWDAHIYGSIPASSLGIEGSDIEVFWVARSYSHILSRAAVDHRTVGGEGKFSLGPHGVDRCAEVMNGEIDPFRVLRRTIEGYAYHPSGGDGVKVFVIYFA